jgi:hypothetical protein
VRSDCNGEPTAVNADDAAAMRMELEQLRAERAS